MSSIIIKTMVERIQKVIDGKEKAFEPLFLDIIAKRVNSGEILPSNVEDNPEPSLDRNILEGATTRGIEFFVRQTISCDNCGKKITRCLSFIRKSKKHFCCKVCQYRVIKPPRTPSPKGMRWSELHSNMQKQG